MGDCQFFAFPTAEERAAFGIAESGSRHLSDMTGALRSAVLAGALSQPDAVGHLMTVSEVGRQMAEDLITGVLPPPGDDLKVVFECGKPQGDGPLFFFVPVPGGAVRVPVCTEHGGYLARLYGSKGGGHDPR